MAARDWLRAWTPRPLRNLLRRPAASARWLRQELAFALGSRPRVAVTPGWTVRCHPASEAAFRAHRDDEDVREELAGFVRHCSPGMVLFDVGSHYGVFALAALHHGGPAARVVAVDPSPVCQRILRANAKLAGSADRVTALRAAVGAEDGVLPMLTTGPAGDHFLVAAAQPRPDATAVREYTLAGLATAVGLTPTHVKIDVEGFEAEVVAGGIEFLRAHRPVVFLELHGDLLRGRGVRPESVLEALAGCGYGRLEWRGRPISAAEAAGRPLVRLIAFPES